MQSAGQNLRVGPGVVIGLKKKAGECVINPIIGNNVYVAANATVIGGITIGDNTVIGAGAVVIDSCEKNSVMVGNPAHNIRAKYQVQNE